jgi:hypothetical protein
VNAVRHDELNLVGVSHPAVCAWSPVVRKLVSTTTAPSAPGRLLANFSTRLTSLMQSYARMPWALWLKVMTCQASLASCPSERSSSEALRLLALGVMDSFPSSVICCRFGPSALSGVWILS